MSQGELVIGDILYQLFSLASIVLLVILFVVFVKNQKKRNKQMNDIEKKLEQISTKMNEDIKR